VRASLPADARLTGSVPDRGVGEARTAGGARHLHALSAELAGLRIGLVHGRLRGDEKAAVMAAFVAGEIDVLVATTVIEVGVDVPTPALMVIEHAERFGLSQLHQLRGPRRSWRA
jgi:RecG-like helicase